MKDKETISELMKSVELTKLDLISIYDRETGEKIFEFEPPMEWFNSNESYEYETGVYKEN